MYLENKITIKASKLQERRRILQIIKAKHKTHLDLKYEKRKKN